MNDPHISDLIANASDVDLDAQPIGWTRSRWEPLWERRPNLPGRDVLDAIDEEVARHGTIRRSWVRTLAQGDPLRLLVASTIWGFGDFNRGPSFLGHMLTDRRGAEPIADVVAGIVAAAKGGAEEGFTALFDDRGRTRISHLGVAFGTKLVHFAGYDSPTGPRPLMFDARVWHATRHVRGCPDLPSPTDYVRSVQYRGYCSWAEQVAAAATADAVEPATVEYVLFIYGGELARRRGTRG